MVPGDMYEWSWEIFAKKTKFHDAGGPTTVVSPLVDKFVFSFIINTINMGKQEGKYDRHITEIWNYQYKINNLRTIISLT